MKIERLTGREGLRLSLGEMVTGYEIEEGILTHPSVQDCAVIGVPESN